jgi:hypothetical protein
METTSVCGVITGSGTDRARCLNPDFYHRGPHWTEVEKILCECRFSCQGHHA